MLLLVIFVVYCLVTYLLFLLAIRNKFGKASREYFTCDTERMIIFLISPFSIWVLFPDMIKGIAESKFVKRLFNDKE